jgi:hypothetical protein
MATVARIDAATPGYPRILKWSDYRFVTDSLDPPFEASTHTSYKITQWAFTLGAAPGESKGGLYVDPFKVTTSLESDSWAVRGAEREPRLLAHEQGHFDITGLIARELAARVLDLRVTGNEFPRSFWGSPADSQESVRTINKVLKSRMTRVTERMGALWDFLQGSAGVDGAYDIDTAHGTDRTAQRTWSNMLSHVRIHHADFEQTLLRRGFVTIVNDPPNTSPTYR